MQTAGSVLTMRTLAPNKRSPFRATATPARDTQTLTMRQSSLERHADWYEASLPELLAAEKVPVWQPDRCCSLEDAARLRAQVELLQRELHKAKGWDGWDGEADTVAEPSLRDLAAQPSLLAAAELSLRNFAAVEPPAQQPQDRTAAEPPRDRGAMAELPPAAVGEASYGTSGAKPAAARQVGCSAGGTRPQDEGVAQVGGEAQGGGTVQGGRVAQGGGVAQVAGAAQGGGAAQQPRDCGETAQPPRGGMAEQRGRGGMAPPHRGHGAVSAPLRSEALSDQATTGDNPPAAACEAGCGAGGAMPPAAGGGGCGVGGARLPAAGGVGCGVGGARLPAAGGGGCGVGGARLPAAVGCNAGCGTGTGLAAAGRAGCGAGARPAAEPASATAWVQTEADLPAERHLLSAARRELHERDRQVEALTEQVRRNSNSREHTHVRTAWTQA